MTLNPLIIASQDALLPGSAPAAATPRYLHFLDVLRGVAAQLIVLHHLAFYGPMSDHVRPSAPLLMGWLEMHARMAVQLFLVIAGFLAARSLAPDGVARMATGLPRRVGRRYLMLAPPFTVAMLLAVGASAWAGHWMTHDSLSPVPTLAQLAAHALLLHGVLDFESISAGAWYVAIDFQLYAMLVLLIWTCARLAPGRAGAGNWLLPAAVTVGVCASLFWFNRNASFDVWGVYFFGSYGLGALAYWASAPVADARQRRLLVAAMLVPAIAALALDFRSRIALALLTAGFIAWAARGKLPRRFAAPAPLLWLGRISYSVFLVHFSVSMVVNAAFTRYAPASAGWQGLGMALAWAASILGGAAFFRLVEEPLARLLNPVVSAAATMPCANVLPLG